MMQLMGCNARTDELRHSRDQFAIDNIAIPARKHGSDGHRQALN
ncbi:hypothetical protein CsSME_00011484 [Camellia sinensis var. sinensis]